MGQLVYILGRSGTGKSYSLRNFDKGEIAVVNVQGKILPFKGAERIEAVTCDDSSEIVEYIKTFSKRYKRIVVDDFQYVMANEFMRRAMERGYDKFTEIARHAWDIATCVTSLPRDVIVYILCHTDTDAEGTERLKTIGRLLDEKINLEGMSTIVLKTNVSDGKYCFVTQNNGKDTTKSPAGMFPTYAIDNDLKYVDDKIRSYYAFDGAKSDAEMEAEDGAARKDDVKPEERKRRGRRVKEEPVKDVPEEKTADEKPVEENSTPSQEEPTSSQEEPTPTPTRRRRRNLTAEAEKERMDAANKSIENIPEGVDEEVDFNDIPVRKEREEVPTEAPAESKTQEETPVRRRRRRV